MDGSETSFLLGRPICRCVLVSFREGLSQNFPRFFCRKSWSSPFWCCDTGPSLPQDWVTEVSVSKSTGTVPTGTPWKDAIPKEYGLNTTSSVVYNIYTVSRKENILLFHNSNFVWRSTAPGKTKIFPTGAAFFSAAGCTKDPRTILWEPSAKNYVDCHFVQMFGLPVPAFLEKPILVEISLGKGFDS